MALRAFLQHGDYANAVGSDGRPLNTKTKGAGVLDLTLDYRPATGNEFFAWIRLAAGNALNKVGGVALDAYGEPLEDELKDINGSGRDYLLEVWYKRSFVLPGRALLGVSAGIIDAAEYLGDNEFADEADTQFMNEALETSNIDMLSYRPGAILELGREAWSLNAVYTRAKTEDGAGFNWVSGQVAYQAESEFGEGNYRVFAFTSDEAFADRSGARSDERFKGLGVSFDQEFGEVFGAFVRGIWADDRAVVDFHRLWSGGVNINGSLWGRRQDNAGIGYAYLRGPAGSELRRGEVAEAYVRFQITRRLDLSLDLQFQRNTLYPGVGEDEAGSDQGPRDPRAWIAGIRINLGF